MSAALETKNDHDLGTVQLGRIATLSSKTNGPDMRAHFADTSVGAVRFPVHVSDNVRQDLSQLGPQSLAALQKLRFSVSYGLAYAHCDEYKVPLIPRTEPLKGLYRMAAGDRDLSDDKIPHDLLAAGGEQLKEFAEVHETAKASGVFWAKKGGLGPHVDLFEPGKFGGHWNLSEEFGMNVVSAVRPCEMEILHPDGYVDPDQLKDIVKTGQATISKLKFGEMFYFGANAVHESNNKGHGLRMLMKPQ
jgi:hypothetical protein